MSAETIEWLNANSLIGFTAQRGNAWHYREGSNNHFEGPIPVERVMALLDVPLVEGTVSVTVNDEDGNKVTIPADDRKAIVRLDTREVFEFFKGGYQIHHYDQWLRQRLDTLLHGGLQFGSAILLKGGAVAAVQVELPDTREASSRGAEPVKHRPHVTAATSSNGSMATDYWRGTKIWVCDNTLAEARSEKGALHHKVRHSRNSLARINDIRADLDLLVEETGDEFDNFIRELTAKHVSDQKFEEVVKAYTGVERAQEGRSKSIAQNKQAALLDLWRNDERVAPWRNSAWGVLAAFNTADHHLLAQKGDVAKRVERNELRELTGDREKFDNNVLRLLETV